MGGEVVRVLLRSCLRGDALERRLQLIVRRLGVAKDGVAFSGEALIELDHGAPDGGTLLTQVPERALDVRLVAEVLRAFRKIDARLAKDAPASGFASPVRQLGSADGAVLLKASTRTPG